MKWLCSIGIIPSFAVFAAAQSSLFSTSCVPGSQQTAFPNCDRFNNYTTCAVPSNTNEEWKDCLCNQDYINSLPGCESEVRLCFLDTRLDLTYQTALSLWHSLCNTFTTFPTTTPTLSTISASYDALCGDSAIGEACATARLLFDDCSSSFSAPNLLTSCVCQPQFLSLDYSCEYLGNTSCLGIPATVEELVGYGCSNFGAVIGTGIASHSIVTVSAFTTGSSSNTPAPTRSLPIASQTATTTKSSGARAYVTSWLTCLVFVPFFLWVS